MPFLLRPAPQKKETRRNKKETTPLPAIPLIRRHALHNTECAFASADCANLPRFLFLSPFSARRVFANLGKLLIRMSRESSTSDLPRRALSSITAVRISFSERCELIDTTRACVTQAGKGGKNRSSCSVVALKERIKVNCAGSVN